MSISTVTSEALQSKLRELLPSQQGFGTDLSASDTIIPVIDLTAAAEGSSVGENLQTALAFGSQTSTRAQSSTVTVTNTVGFSRITGSIGTGGLTVGGSADISITDGLSTKVLYKNESITYSSGQDATQQMLVDFVVFLNSGDSVTATANASAVVNLTSRQIADVNGVLVNPVGFSPQ